MAQYARWRANTGRDGMPRMLQDIVDRLRKIEMSYTSRDTPAVNGVVLTGPEGHTWQVGVDEHGRLIAQNGSGDRTVIASGNYPGGMV